jgi:hypothetical protein
MARWLLAQSRFPDHFGLADVSILEVTKSESTTFKLYAIGLFFSSGFLTPTLL